MSFRCSDTDDSCLCNSANSYGESSEICRRNKSLLSSQSEVSTNKKIHSRYFHKFEGQQCANAESSCERNINACKKAEKIRQKATKILEKTIELYQKYDDSQITRKCIPKSCRRSKSAHEDTRSSCRGIENQTNKFYHTNENQSSCIRIGSPSIQFYQTTECPHEETDIPCRKRGRTTKRPYMGTECCRGESQILCKRKGNPNRKSRQTIACCREESYCKCKRMNNPCIKTEMPTCECTCGKNQTLNKRIESPCRTESHSLIIKSRPLVRTGCSYRKIKFKKLNDVQPPTVEIPTQTIPIRLRRRQSPRKKKFKKQKTPLKPVPETVKPTVVEEAEKHYETVGYETEGATVKNGTSLTKFIRTNKPQRTSLIQYVVVEMPSGKVNRSKGTKLGSKNMRIYQMAGNLRQIEATHDQFQILDESENPRQKPNCMAIRKDGDQFYDEQCQSLGERELCQTYERPRKRVNCRSMKTKKVGGQGNAALKGLVKSLAIERARDQCGRCDRLDEPIVLYQIIDSPKQRKKGKDAQIKRAEDQAKTTCQQSQKTSVSKRHTAKSVATKRTGNQVKTTRQQYQPIIRPTINNKGKCIEYNRINPAHEKYHKIAEQRMGLISPPDTFKKSYNNISRRQSGRKSSGQNTPSQGTTKANVPYSNKITKSKQKPYYQDAATVYDANDFKFEPTKQVRKRDWGTSVSGITYNRKSYLKGALSQGSEGSIVPQVPHETTTPPNTTDINNAFFLSSGSDYGSQEIEIYKKGLAKSAGNSRKPSNASPAQSNSKYSLSDWSQSGDNEMRVQEPSLLGVSSKVNGSKRPSKSLSQGTAAPQNSKIPFVESNLNSANHQKSLGDTSLQRDDLISSSENKNAQSLRSHAETSGNSVKNKDFDTLSKTFKYISSISMSLLSDSEFRKTEPLGPSAKKTDSTNPSQQIHPIQNKDLTKIGYISSISASLASDAFLTKTHPSLAKTKINSRLLRRSSQLKEEGKVETRSQEEVTNNDPIAADNQEKPRKISRRKKCDVKQKEHNEDINKLGDDAPKNNEEAPKNCEVIPKNSVEVPENNLVSPKTSKEAPESSEDVVKENS